jgi:hypothetical protein
MRYTRGGGRSRLRSYRIGSEVGTNVKKMDVSKVPVEMRSSTPRIVRGREPSGPD